MSKSFAKSYLASLDDDPVDADDFNATVLDQATLIFLLISALIAATIVFEIGKEYVMRSASKYTQPIFDALLSEMTILGFISLIAFVATYGSTLEDLSVDIFGDGREYFITDLVDDVQGYIMWVMVMTISHILCLLYIKQNAEAEFSEFNDIVQDDEKLKKSLRAIDDLPSVGPWSRIVDYTCNPVRAYQKYSEIRRLESFAIFHSLRREHILNRSEKEEDHFQPEEPDKRLPKDFDFAMYLSISMSNFMAGVASFTPLSWCCVWLYILVIFALVMLCNGQFVILASILLFFDYVDVYLVHLAMQHIHLTYEKLTNPLHLKFSSKKKNKGVTRLSIDERSNIHSTANASGSRDQSEDHQQSRSRSDDPLQQSSGDDDAVDELDQLFPARVDPDHSSFVYRLRHSNQHLPAIYREPVHPQGWFSRLVLGEQELSRHESIIWGDKMSTPLFTFLFRIHILFVDITFPIAVGLMVPYIFDEYGIWPGVVFLFLLSIPWFLLLTTYYSTILGGLGLILFSGRLRDNQLQSESLRILKMNKVLRLMIALSKLSNAEKKTDVNFGTREYDVNDPEIQAEIAQIEKIFGEYASKAGCDELNREQLKDVVLACGVQLDEQGYAELFIVCDSDGNGAISQDEFVAWMMSRDLEEPKDEDSMLAYGKHIFGMIDVDGSGEITLDEFRVALRKFNEPPYNAGFTDSEILSLLRDFDEDGDGNISLEEFLKAIEVGCNLV